MRNIFLVLGSLCLVVSIYAFTLSRKSRLISEARVIKRNIISCGPAGPEFAKTGFLNSFPMWNDNTGEVAINDNRKPAGELLNGVLYLKLETRVGEWFPETREGKGLQVHAFAEAGKPMQLPGPMIRVKEGTVISAEIHHRIPGSPLVLHGFYSRPGNPADSVSIPYDSTYRIQFIAGKAGTYFYWASDNTLKDEITHYPYFNDSQLTGAFIIDPPNVIPDPMERVFVIGIWNDTLNGPLNGEELVINGLTWPYTERLFYENNRAVNWRVINASYQSHPMHLHGFYFKVNGRGNADSTHLYSTREQFLAVTELLRPHQTISMKWMPEREGNWLFHCHTLVHILTGSFLRNMDQMTDEHMNNIDNHARDGMGGLMMGITVLPDKKGVKEDAGKMTERALTLIVTEKRNWIDSLRGIGFILKDGNYSSDLNGTIPGPPLILERGKPVSIKIINRLKEPTTLHWHGLEIESYYDGVAGWGNKGKKLAPLIMPGDSFIVHMTPPRSGTFMYHTHMHNNQLLEGMYGPIIIREPMAKYDTATDKTFMLSQTGPDFDHVTVLLNGIRKTDTMNLKHGINYRFRFINITPVGPTLNVGLSVNGKPVSWRRLAKDGADLIEQQQITRVALNQTVSIGETMDFSFNPTVPGDYLLEVKSGLGKLRISKILSVH
jgi:FtsP/CotA-like multicopper oxidase with cupredoxin domain